MGWRSVVVSKGATLRYARRRLVIEQEQVASVPLEDIAVLVLDSAEILLTSRLLLECMEAGIVVLTVGQSHLPNGALLPFLPHSRPLKMLERQLSAPQPRKKRAWQRIVRQKLLNQAACLDLCGKPDGPLLSKMAGAVKSGDAGNLEAVAAQHYFPILFGHRFHRTSPCLRNAALNYGYAVLVPPLPAPKLVMACCRCWGCATGASGMPSTWPTTGLSRSVPWWNCAWPNTGWKRKSGI